MIAKMHVEELGYCMLDPGARCIVASVDTLIRRTEDPRYALVTLWVVDEGHHLVLDNKWHVVVERFKNPAVRGLLPTATPKRADGGGLGRGHGGVADVMVQGPPMRWLIEQGYLCDYRVFCPPTDMEVLGEVGKSGDWSTKQLREAAKRSHIVGDVVKSYLQYGAGRLWITFSPDVETATEMTAAYRLAGVRAETLTGKTDDYVRRQILKRFAAREIDQIVAVDIISEGFDLPAIEGASFARRTESLALYMQQFGRTLRPMEGKERAIIIDHVANIIRHQGPPDKPRPWSLERSGGGSSSGGGIPYRICAGPVTVTHPDGGCFQPYERVKPECPYCGYVPIPSNRGSPAAVDGDIAELDPEVLAELRKSVAEVDKSRAERMGELMQLGGTHQMIVGNCNRHDERQEAQRELRAAMAGFGGRLKVEGYGDKEMQRRFYFKYGMDILTAMSLGTNDARTLAGRINLDA